MKSNLVIDCCKLNPHRAAAYKRLMGFSKHTIAAYLSASAPFGVAWHHVKNIERLTAVKRFIELQREEKRLEKKLTPARKRRLDERRLTATDWKVLKPLARCRGELKRLDKIIKENIA